MDQACSHFPLTLEEYIMRPWILGAILSGGMALVPISPANAQMTFSFGRSAYSPGVSIGQPAYTNGYYGQPASPNGYYGQPASPNGYYNQPAYPNSYYGPAVANNRYYAPPASSNYYAGQPAYGVPRYAPNNYVQTYP